MSQNYIKSLKVDEYAWQTIYFRGSIGREPMQSGTYLGKNMLPDIKLVSEQALVWNYSVVLSHMCGMPNVACILLVILFLLSDPWPFSQMFFRCDTNVNSTRSNIAQIQPRALFGLSNLSNQIHLYILHPMFWCEAKFVFHITWFPTPQ